MGGQRTLTAQHLPRWAPVGPGWRKSCNGQLRGRGGSWKRLGRAGSVPQTLGKHQCAPLTPACLPRSVPSRELWGQSPRGRGQPLHGLLSAAPLPTPAPSSASPRQMGGHEAARPWAQLSSTGMPA